MQCRQQRDHLGNLTGAIRTEHTKTLPMRHRQGERADGRGSSRAKGGRERFGDLLHHHSLWLFLARHHCQHSVLLSRHIIATSLSTNLRSLHILIRHTFGKVSPETEEWVSRHGMARVQHRV